MKKSVVWKDPIVEEVRKHRKEIESECEGNYSLLFAKAKEIEEKFKGRLVSRVLKRKTKRNNTVNA